MWVLFQRAKKTTFAELVRLRTQQFIDSLMVKYISEDKLITVVICSQKN